MIAPDSPASSYIHGQKPNKAEFLLRHCVCLTFTDAAARLISAPKLSCEVKCRKEKDC